nr:unnamed protein product [Spirometra erinaceieuropaei]
MALAVLDRARRQHRDWFDDDDTAISNLLAENNRPTDDNRAAIYRSRRLIQQRLREMQDAWTARKAEEIQERLRQYPLTEKTQILQQWAQHFRSAHNRPPIISDVAITGLPQVETNTDLDLSYSLHETFEVLQQLSSGKESGSDAIPAEIYKHGGPQIIDHLKARFQEMWRQGEIPQDFKDGTVVHLYKRKGNSQLCDNHQDISLPNIAGKIFACILLNSLNHHMEQGFLQESQCDFRRRRGITDMIFATCQLQEKCQEKPIHLYSIFADLRKAFDKMVCQHQDGLMAGVTDNGTVSEAFAVTNGVKQGCMLSSTVFSFIFSAILMDAYRDNCPGIRIAYRKDGQLLNQRRMNFRSLTSLRRRLRPQHHLGGGHAKKYGSPRRRRRRLQQLRPGHQHRVNGGYTSRATRRCLCPTPNQPEQCSSTWALYKKQARRPNQSHLSCLRRILKLRLQDWISDKVILERARILSIYAMPQLRRSGHLVRLLKRLFYGYVTTGSRLQEGQVRRQNDTLETSLKRLQINAENWKDLA